MTFWSALFLALLAIHVVHSLVANRKDATTQPRTLIALAFLLQAPLFLVACYLGAHHEVYSRQLVSPVYIALGLVAGHLIFGLSLFATHRSLRDAWSHFFDFGPIWNFTFDSPIVLTRFLGVAVGEEFIWRVAAQPAIIGLTGNAVVGIVVTAILFSVVHKHFFRNPFWVSVEFVGFALLLGALYHVTQSLILVIVIHAVRDIEIAYLEYLIKVEELGDADLAAREVEKSYMRGQPERL